MGTNQAARVRPPWCCSSSSPSFPRPCLESRRVPASPHLPSSMTRSGRRLAPGHDPHQRARPAPDGLTELRLHRTSLACKPSPSQDAVSMVGSFGEIVRRRRRRVGALACTHLHVVGVERSTRMKANLGNLTPPPPPVRPCCTLKRAVWSLNQSEGAFAFPTTLD